MHLLQFVARQPVADAEQVSINKLGSWFLLMIISYVMVSVVSRPQEIGVADTPRPAGPGNASPIS